MTPGRWHKLMNTLGITDGADVYDQLSAAYSDPHRHYHSVAHIADCLERLDEARHFAEALAEVEIALWFHDAIYDPMSSKNELKSAEWANEFLSGAGIEEPVCGNVYSHIMATVHESAPADGDTALLVDIDLSILGRNNDVYDQFEQNVRKEYRWVPKPLYRHKRKEILLSFLARETIFATRFFKDRYESQARVNLRNAIDNL